MLLNKKGQTFLKQFNFLGLFYIVTIGFVILQLVSLMMTDFFGKEPILVGPYIMGSILIGAVWAAIGLVNRIFKGDERITYQKNARRYILTLILAGIILYLIYTNLEQLTPEFFEQSILAMSP